MRALVTAFAFGFAYIFVALARSATLDLRWIGKPDGTRRAIGHGILWPAFAARYLFRALRTAINDLGDAA